LCLPFADYREGTNLLRREASRLADEVDALSKAVSALETEANLMKTYESELYDIARKQGVSVDKIVSLTRENEEILAKQKVGISNFNQLLL
jgi:prophage DNA circulation protein